MHLTRLELQGFKSFAKKTALEFPKSNSGRGMTAIVGPNGSGKTNVVDAIRWVLGEQSLKVLRGKKSEDVLFAGSSKKAPSGIAEVSLYLENDEKKLPVDWREVAITRRAYRSGENEYLLNKAKVRLHDIQLLLAQGQFGEKTYSVIGQGMVDSILAASPYERKEFFDDAAGVKPYNLKKEQALKKLEATRENLAQAEVLLQEIEPRYRSLSRQVKKFERREATLEELRDLQKTYFGSRLHSLSSHIKKIEKDLQAIKVKEIEKEKELTALKEEMARAEHTITGGKNIQSCLDDLSHLHKEFLAKVEGRSEVPTAEIQETVQTILAKIGVWQREFAGYDAAGKEDSLLQKFFALQKEFLYKQDELRPEVAKKQEIEVTLARLTTQREDLENEIGSEMAITKENIVGVLQDTPASTPEAGLLDIQNQIAKTKMQLEIIGGIDPETKDEFEQTKERYEFLKNQSEDLTQAMESLQKVIKELESKIEKQFQEAFQKIKEKFSYYFRHLFSGGEATLEVVEEEQREEEPLDKESAEPPPPPRIGVEIKGSPPGKRVKNIASLSGGERALTSLSLLYAILACRPSPFVVLDEVDAALDEANSRRSSEILKELSETIQFIIITHNRTTMEQADTIYGVTMGDEGSSKLLSLRLEDVPKE